MWTKTDIRTTERIPQRESSGGIKFSGSKGIWSTTTRIHSWQDSGSPNAVDPHLENTWGWNTEGQGKSSAFGISRSSLRAPCNSQPNNNKTNQATTIANCSWPELADTQRRCEWGLPARPRIPRRIAMHPLRGNLLGNGLTTQLCNKSETSVLRPSGRSLGVVPLHLRLLWPHWPKKMLGWSM